MIKLRGGGQRNQQMTEFNYTPNLVPPNKAEMVAVIIAAGVSVCQLVLLRCGTFLKA